LEDLQREEQYFLSVGAFSGLFFEFVLDKKEAEDMIRPHVRQYFKDDEGCVAYRGGGVADDFEGRDQESIHDIVRCRWRLGGWMWKLRSEKRGRRINGTLLQGQYRFKRLW